jgi:hypothetical protein
MKNLIVILTILISTSVFGQVDSYGRIDYQKFDKELFDSLMLDEVNYRRTKMKLTPFVFDSICFLSANYQVRVMTQKNVIKQIHDVDLDGVKLNSPLDRYEYFNNINQVLDVNRKNFESENFTGISIGVKSKTFTYEKLVNFILDEFFVGSEVQNNLYGNYGSVDLFTAFSVGLKLSEEGSFYEIYVNNVISTK